jgi:hypothetical protein
MGAVSGIDETSGIVGEVRDNADRRSKSHARTQQQREVIFEARVCTGERSRRENSQEIMLSGQRREEEVNGRWWEVGGSEL